MKTFYECERCGQIHSRREDIFVIAGKEMCTECASYQKINIPDCGFGCTYCYDTCPMLENS